MGAEEYVERWSGPDFTRVGQHDRRTIRSELWPWLLERGHASPQDEAELDPFLDRLEKRKRDAHLRPVFGFFVAGTATRSSGSANATHSPRRSAPL
jgi:hypothetical protein